MRRALLAVLFAAACHHADSSPASAGADLPPLPPLSASSVGLLIDRADQLHLTADQLAKLQTIDRKVTSINGGLQAELDQMERVRAEKAEEGKNQPEGLDAIEESDSAEVKAGGDPKDKHHPDKGAAQPGGKGDDEQKIEQEIEDNDRAALDEALKVLTDDQRKAAEELLSKQHRDARPPSPGEGGEGGGGAGGAPQP